MASIFSGLGAAIGAGAKGYLTGQNKGEAEGYRRERLAEERELKKLALAARKKELDPDKQVRDLAGREYLAISAELSDSNKVYELQETSPELWQRKLRRLHLSGQVASGQLPASAWQPDEPMFGAQPPLPPPDAPITQLPGGRPLPPDFPQVGADADTAIPLPSGGLAAPPREAPDLDLLRRVAAAQPNLLRLAPQGEPQVAPGQAPAPPPSLSDQLTAVASNPPVQEPGEPSRRFNQRRAQWAAEVGARANALQAIPRAEKTGKEADLVTSMGEAKIKGIEAGTESKKALTGLTTERTTTERAMRPVKKGLGESRIAKIADDMKLGWAKLNETQRHNKRAEAVQQMNAETNRLRQTDTAGYHRALVDQVRFRMNNFPIAELGRNLRAKLAADVRIISAQIGIGQIKTSEAASPDQAVAAANRIQATLDRMDEGVAPAAAAAAAAPASAKVPAPVKSAAPVKVPAPVKTAPGVKSALRRTIEGSDDAHLRAVVRGMKANPALAGKIPEFLKEYREHRGRPWKG